MTWLSQASRDLRPIRISATKDVVPTCRAAAPDTRRYRFVVGW